MANQYDTRPFGEHNTPMRPSKAPMPRSTIEPLPYFPALCRLLSGVTISLVVCYLEIHHPAPEPDLQSFTGHQNPPIFLDCDQACEDLGVSRRTLHVSLCCLSTWWSSELERQRAARASREFLNPDHSRYGRLKFYSVTGSKTLRPGTVIQIRRNYGHLAKLLQDAGIATLAVPVPAIAIPFTKLADNAVLASTLNAPERKMSLTEILSSVSALGEDRRSTRYPRLRAAVAAGLRPASALKVRRNMA
jgi:hypothetical protein